MVKNKKDNLSALCFIAEQTSYPEDYKNNFGYKKIDKGDRFYLIFEAVLQSFGVTNRNRRIYMADNIMDRINNDPYIQSMLKQNSWMGQLEHPASMYEGQNLSMNYLANVDPSKTSHYIRKPRLNGNLLEATIQTDSSNANGMNMAIKITDGKVIPGFSARVLGELTNRGGQPVVNVKKLVTYDYVLFPSHPEALGKVNKPYAESAGVKTLEKAINGKIIFFDELAKAAAHSSSETEFLCESFGLSTDSIVGLTSTGNSVVIKENENFYVQPLSDRRVRAKTHSIIHDWLNS